MNLQSGNISSSFQEPKLGSSNSWGWTSWKAFVESLKDLIQFHYKNILLLMERTGPMSFGSRFGTAFVPENDLKTIDRWLHYTALLFAPQVFNASFLFEFHGSKPVLGKLNLFRFDGKTKLACLILLRTQTVKVSTPGQANGCFLWKQFRSGHRWISPHLCWILISVYMWFGFLMDFVLIVCFSLLAKLLLFQTFHYRMYL